MWIKTQKGNLCNLDRATDVILSMTTDHDKPYDVRVYSNGLDDFTTIFGGTKEQCREVMEEIALWALPHELNSIARHTKSE